MRLGLPKAKFRLSPSVIICASLTLAAVAITAFVVMFARARDADQVTIEQRIVGSAIKDSLAKLGDALAPNTYWDIAYDQVGDRIDPAWANSNLGPYAQETSHTAAVLVFGQSGKLLYEYFPSDAAGAHRSDPHTTSAIKALLSRANSRREVPPFVSTGFVEVGDTVYLGAASAIVPSDERANGPLKRRNLEVYLRKFDASSIAKVQSDFGVSNVVLTHTPPAKHFAHVSLFDAAGAPVAYLEWRAARPGHNFALSVLPFALTIMCLIGVLQTLALRGWTSAVRTLERKRVEAARFKEESWAKTMFLANMSHELRTPLNAIIGFSEIITGELVGPVPPRYREYATDIHDSGRHLLSIVNDVLDLTKLQNAEHVECVAVRVGEATETALKILKEAAQRAAVKLEIAAARDDLTALASEKSLNQIVLNLGSNAIKFSEPGSCVKIAFDRPAHSELIQITVADQGCGIPPDKLPLLGQPFYQAQSSYNRKHGTGLGLAITKTLIAKLDGDIKIESEVGVGTTATVTLRACANAA